MIRELARACLDLDLGADALRTELQLTLDPGAWPHSSLGGTPEEPFIQEYSYEHGYGISSGRQVHARITRWRLFLRKHVDPMGCLPPWLICYLPPILFPQEPPHSLESPLGLRERTDAPPLGPPYSPPLLSPHTALD